MVNRKLYIAAASLLVLGAALAIFFLVVSASRERESKTQPATDSATLPSEAQQPHTAKRPTLEPVRGSGEHDLRGVVRGADGTPVALASITAVLELGPGIYGQAPADAGLLGSAAVVATSNATGEFVLEGLEAGRYRLLVESPEILNSEVRFVEAPGEDLQLLVSRSVDVRGHVLFDNKPVAKVKIVLQSEGSIQLHEQVSDATGSFHFADMPEGNFRISAIGTGQAARIQELTRLGTGPFAPVALLLEPAFAVRGRVIEAEGSKLGLIADVRLRDEQGREAERTTRSVADGSFVIESVLAGRWTAEAHSPGYLPSTALSFSAESERSLDLALGEGASVVGVVLGPHGDPVAGAAVVLQGVGLGGETLRYSQAVDSNLLVALGPGQRLLPRGELGVLLGPIPLPPPKGSSATKVATVLGAAALSALPEPESLRLRRSQFTSDARGEFRILGVQAGEYRLLVAHPLWADMATESFAVRLGKPLASRSIRMHAGTRLLGKVADEQGVPIIGASVLVEFSDARDPVMTLSDSAGHFVLDAIVGEVSLVVSAVGYTRSVQKRKLAAGSLTVAEESIEVRLARANLSIAGRVVDASGFPVRAAELRVETTDQSLPGKIVRSDDEGLFRLDGLAKGDHWVGAQHADYPPTRSKLNTESPAELVMQLGGALDILLRDRESQAAIAMAEIELTFAGKSAPSPVQLRSDESGAAHASALWPGSYLLRVQKPGYAALSQSTRVPKGTRVGEVTQTVTLELVRGATIAGIVRDRQGDRLVGARISAGLVSARSDSEGRFRLSDVPSGDVALRIEHGKQVSVQALQLQAGEERVTLELVFEAGSDSAGPDDAPEADEQDDDDEDDDESDEAGAEDDTDSSE